jgi:integrase
LIELKQRTSAATVIQHRAAIRAYHLAAGVSISASRAFCVDSVASYSREDRRKRRGKVPVNPYNLRRLLGHGDASNVLVLRNRALFVLAQRFRPSELCRIKTSHIMEATSKQVTFQFGAKRVVMDGDAVTHLIEWLKAAGIVDGLLLRSMRKSGRIGEALSEESARWILKSELKSLGVDAARYSLNSLRKGWGMADGSQPPSTIAPRMERRQPSGVPIADIAAIWGIKTEGAAA